MTQKIILYTKIYLSNTYNVKLIHMSIEGCLICIFTAKLLSTMTARHFPKMRKFLHLFQINKWNLSDNEKMVFKIAWKINVITRLFGRMPAKSPFRFSQRRSELFIKPFKNKYFSRKLKFQNFFCLVRLGPKNIPIFHWKSSFYFT